MTPEGGEVHALLNSTLIDGPYVPTGTNLPVPNNKRDNTGPNLVTCGGYSLSSNSDTDKANANLQAQCGNGAFVGKGLTFYATFGNVVAFYCNYAGASNNCYASEFSAANIAITNSCLAYRAGYDHIPDRGDTYGYQRSSDECC